LPDLDNVGNVFIAPDGFLAFQNAFQFEHRNVFPMKFQSLGFFPNGRRPRVLWVGMAAPQALPKLAKAIDESLAKSGVAHEQREFSLHLTLARGKDGKLSSKLREAIAKQNSTVFGEMNATSFCLVESKLKSIGAEYTTLESFSGGPKS